MGRSKLLAENLGAILVRINVPYTKQQFAYFKIIVLG